jgi:hypothetical protein
MDKKQEIIKRVYTDEAGYGSKKETLDDARQVDKSITMNDVNEFFTKYQERKTNLRGYNSYVADAAYEEFQVDLFFTNDWDEFEKQKFRVGLLMIDIFSKYISVIPISSKEQGDVASGILEGFQKMEGKPKVLYTDDEAAFSSNALQKYFEEHNIKHIVSRTHAHVAERAIRTIKLMIVERLEQTEKKQWTDCLFPVLLKYNNKMKVHSTHMTPNEMRKPGNTMNVKIALEMRANHTRKYPEISVGDNVKIYKKKTILDKERKGVWSKEVYTVDLITEFNGQKFYHLKGLLRPLMRYEILKM